jgi:hypothetical protein
MKQRLTESPGSSGCAGVRAALALAALCGLGVALSGCAERQTKPRPFPWATAAMVRPVLPHIAAMAEEEGTEAFPEADLDVPPPPSPLIIINGAPVRPRVPTAPPEPANAVKFEPPQLVPQLTPQETEAAQQQTNLSLSIAERNIGAAQGKKLNATQLDLASKVRSFVTEAREAAHNGDWTRASSAAKKAEVLSEELARSL